MENPAFAPGFQAGKTMADPDYMKRLDVAVDCTSLEEYDLNVSINGMWTRRSYLDPIWRYFWLSSHPCAAFMLTTAIRTSLFIAVLSMFFGLTPYVFYDRNPVLSVTVVVLIFCFGSIYAACSKLQSRFKEVHRDLASARRLAAAKKTYMPYGGRLSA